MTDLDLEAIKARAVGMLADLDNSGVCYWNPRAAGEDILELADEVRRLKGQVALAYEAGKLVERGEAFESEDDTE